MNEKELFTLVGIKELPKEEVKKKKLNRDFPFVSVIVLSLISFLCLFAELIMTKKAY